MVGFLRLGHILILYYYTHSHKHVNTHSMDLEHLPLELVEIINKITPNEDEKKKFVQFSKDKKNPVSLPDNDRFLYEVSHQLANGCNCTTVPNQTH